jgi:hypothetical protein
MRKLKPYKQHDQFTHIERADGDSASNRLMVPAGFSGWYRRLPAIGHRFRPGLA